MKQKKILFQVFIKDESQTFWMWEGRNYTEEKKPWGKRKLDVKKGSSLEVQKKGRMRRQGRGGSCAGPQAHSHSSKRQTSLQPRHRDVKRAAISMPSSQHLVYNLKKKAPWKRLPVWHDSFRTQMKTYRSPYSKTWGVLSCYSFILLLAGYKQTQLRLSLLRGLGHIFQSRHCGLQSWEARKGNMRTETGM